MVDLIKDHEEAIDSLNLELESASSSRSQALEKMKSLEKELKETKNEQSQIKEIGKREHDLEIEKQKSKSKQLEDQVLSVALTISIDTVSAVRRTKPAGPELAAAAICS